MEHSEPLKEALRRNRVARMRPQWIADLEKACGHQARQEDFLPIERSQELRANYFERSNLFTSVLSERAPSGTFSSLNTYQDWHNACYRTSLQNRPAMLRYWPPPFLDKAFQFLSDLPPAACQKEVLLRSMEEDDFGLLRMPAKNILTHAADLWGFLNSQISFFTEDNEHGLTLELNYYTAMWHYERDGLYDLLAWGDFVP